VDPDLATERLGGECGVWLGPPPAPGVGEHDEVDRLDIRGGRPFGRHRRCDRRSATATCRDRFDGAIADFAEAYASQNDHDSGALKAAIADGRVVADPLG